MTIELSNNWEITDEEMFDDPDFAAYAEQFEGYASYDFETYVGQVGDRLFNIHMHRSVNGEVVVGWDTDAERGGPNGCTVAISIPHKSMYLMEFLGLNNLTDDRDAVGVDQARAIKSRLMRSYKMLRDHAVACALIIEDKDAGFTEVSNRMEMQSWQGDTIAAGDDPVAQLNTVHTLASWVKRQRETSVEFHHLVEILGLELVLQEHLDGREDPPTKRR